MPPYRTPSSVLEPVLSALQNRQITFDSLFNGLLDHPALEQPVFESAAAICEKLHRKNSDGVFSWAFDLIRETVCREVLTLTEKRHGLHFNAKKAKTDQLEGAFIQATAEKMRTLGPCLWSLVGFLLNPDRKHRRRATQSTSQEEILQRMGSATEMDLDVIGDYAGMPEADNESPDIQIDDGLADPDGPVEVDTAGPGNDDAQSTKEGKRIQRDPECHSFA